MDKIEAALTATEDNAAAIRVLSNKLSEQAEKLDKIAQRSQGMFMVGTAISSGITFGELESDGTRCVMISFNENVKQKVYFCRKAISSGYSPILVRLPEGRGELTTTASTTVRAFVFALDTIYVKL
ncbi:MAG: hypothetical protein K2K13_03680 [Clostridiales bacterium]|nr:hypothetical protein [Clostridiales bacterium]MDE6618107.1 hypothetical protein [Clostridiales bacterium]